MILTIFELDILIDGLKDQYNKYDNLCSVKNKSFLGLLEVKLKSVRDTMVDEKLTDWELLSDLDRGQRIIRPKYKPDQIDK